MKISFIIVILISLFGTVSAQEEKKLMKVHFGQGEYKIKTTGKAEVDVVLEECKAVMQDSSYKITKVMVRASASLEGSIDVNKRISNSRASSILRYVKSQVALPDSIIEVDFMGYDWKGLYDMVSYSDMPYKEQVVDILENTPEWVFDENGKIIDSRKSKLSRLGGGRAYRYMVKNFFPQMRYSALEMRYIPIDRNLESPISGTYFLVSPRNNYSVDMNIPDTLIPYKKNDNSSFLMAIKTNLLYDAALLPNIGLEFYLGNNWSLSGSWTHAWFSKESKDRFWQTYGGDIELRKWVGFRSRQKRLTGSHFGLYGQMLTYDFMLGSNGYQAKDWSWALGLSYGYSLPLSRSFNLDFSMGIGYLTGEYERYEKEDTHYVWKTTKNRKWFGPTKAEVSLVWLIGNKK